MNSISLNKGLLWGGISVVITFILYFINPELLMKWYVGIISVVLAIVFMVMAVKEFKSKNNGAVTFGEGLMTSWLTGVIGGTITTVVGYMLFNYIDPSLVDMIRDMQLEALESQASSLSDEQYEQQLKFMEKMNPSSTIFTIATYVIYAILGLIVSLIIAAVMKHEKPEWE